MYTLRNAVLDLLPAWPTKTITVALCSWGTVLVFEQYAFGFLGLDVSTAYSRKRTVDPRAVSVWATVGILVNGTWDTVMAMYDRA
jgi:hypothetical protein